MSDATPNKSTLEHIYRRWHETRGGSLEEMIDVFADDIEFGSLADGADPVAFTAPAKGKEQMRGYFNGLLTDWSMIHYTIDHMIAEGDRIAAVGSTAWIFKATGKKVETRKVDVWRFKDGRVVEFYEYFDTAKLFAATTPA
jgi:ketosteroid isomerase-like protein